MTQVVATKRDLPFWKRPFSFTFLIDLTTVLYIISVYTFSFNELNFISKGLAFILMALLAIYALQKKSIRFDGLGICLSLFTVICLLSCLWALEISVAFSDTVTMVQILILVILLYNYIQKEEKAELFITVMCIAATIFAIYTVFYFGIEEYFKGLEEGDRMGTGINNVNAIGMMTANAFILNLWQIFYRKKWIYILPAGICLVVSLGAASRTAVAGLIVGTFALFVFKGRGYKRLFSLLQCAGILLLLYLILQLPAFDVFMDRIDKMILAFFGESGADNASQVRLEMVELGLQTFYKYPISGVGIGNSGIITQQLGFSTYLHNNYIELLASVGIIGTVIYYLMFIIPFGKTIKPAFKENQYAVIAVALIIMNLLFHIGTVQYYNKVSYLYIILFFVCIKKTRGYKDVEKD